MKIIKAFLLFFFIFSKEFLTNKKNVKMKITKTVKNYKNPIYS